MRQLAPTLRYEGLLLAEMAGTAGTFADLDADVLLIGGAMKRPAFIRPAFDLLAQTLPHHRCVIIPASATAGPATSVRPTVTASRNGSRRSSDPSSPAMTDNGAVVVNGVVKRYGALTAVRGASFAVAENEIFALLGPNGAGQDHRRRDPGRFPTSRRGSRPRGRVWTRGCAAPPASCANRSDWCCRTSWSSPT